MVRLKEEQQVTSCLDAVFQFHYGTIKSKISINYLINIYIFQFHYGTIKSEAHIRGISELRYFNSTMVRLKGAGETPLTVPEPHFNSTMVRLKVCNLIAFRSFFIISIPLWYD